MTFSITKNVSGFITGASLIDRETRNELIAQNNATRCLALYTTALDAIFAINGSFANPLAIALLDSFRNSNMNPVKLMNECVAIDCLFEFIFSGIEGRLANIDPEIPGSNKFSNKWKNSIYAQ